MRTVRRFYFYLMAMVSLEAALWGLITLARTIFSSLPVGGTTDLLASGLALVIVSLPIFLVHWVVVQRDADRDSEERGSRLRAIFLYGVCLATLLPVVQSLLAIFSRTILTFLGRSANEALWGSGQTLADNLIAIVINLAAWAYFNHILSSDWKMIPSDGVLKETRRLYRYIWVVYALILTVMGVQQVLRYILYLPQDVDTLGGGLLGNGLALLLLGLPLWTFFWLTVQRSLDDPGERQSTLRTVVFYALALIGAGTFLTAFGLVLGNVFRRLLGESQNIQDFLNISGDPLSLTLPFGVLWGYFHSCLQVQVKSEAEPTRRASLGRLYLYILSLAGCAVVFFGAWGLLSTVVEIMVGSLEHVEAMRMLVSSSLALLVIGLPLWLRPWQTVQAEARQSDSPGDNARRSVVRKGYLYLTVFVTVVGGMVAAGMLFYLVFTRLLVGSAPNFKIELFQRLSTLLLLLVWFVYHLRILLQDGKLAHQALGNRHAIFPVLVFDQEGIDFSDMLVNALHHQAPRLPVHIHSFKESLLEDVSDFRVVILPAELALNPPESLRVWLKEFHGKRLVVPLPVNDSVILGSAPRPALELAKDTAAAVRQLAEGQTVRVSAASGPWATVGIVLGVLFGMQLLMVLVGLLLSAMGN